MGVARQRTVQVNDGANECSRSTLPEDVPHPLNPPPHQQMEGGEKQAVDISPGMMLQPEVRVFYSFGAAQCWEHNIHQMDHVKDRVRVRVRVGTSNAGLC